MLRFHALHVSEVCQDAQDAVCVTLEVPVELAGEFRARPGQHVVVRAQWQREEIRRTYSLVSAPGELPLRIAVRTHPRGRFSAFLATALRAGDAIEVMPPNGSFGPRLPLEENGMYVAFTSGCGIAPVLPIIKDLLRGTRAGEVVLFYGNRSAERAMLIEELFALKNRYVDRLALHFLMSREQHEIEILNGRLDAAKVRSLAGKLFDPARTTDFFVCGPGTMIEEVGGALRDLGIDRARIHSEHFGADASTAHAVHGAPEETGETLTEVGVLMDGRRRSFTMRTGEESILEAAERAGLDLPFSCKAGVCATCRTKLVRGKVNLAQNHALEDWELEQGFVLACQAYAETAQIELDYDAR